MAARAGMLTLITRLRGMTNAGTADWSDEALQDVLDARRVDLNRAPLTPDPEYVSGTTLWHDYYAPLGNFEEASSGAQYWRVENTSGEAVGTADYTVDYAAGHIRFAADQGGTAYYLRARSYQMNLAAADVWRRKAAIYAERYDVQTDNHRLSRSQVIAHCLKMAAEYEAKAGIQSVQVVRGDLV